MRIVLILAVAAAAAYMSPIFMVHQLDGALESQDPLAVDKYVDFDAVKTYMANTASQDAGGEGSVIGALAGGITKAIGNVLATPDVMINQLKDKPDRMKLAIDDNMLNLVKRGSWVSLDQFVVRNYEGEPKLLLTRRGITWEVTGLKI